jgi:quinol monooxygenase YgiN
MIHVVASVRVKADRLADFLELFKSTARQVRKEKGCIQYIPTVSRLLRSGIAWKRSAITL